MVRVAINGYGRIGRVAHRVILQWHSDEVEVAAINVGHSTDLKGWMYLLKYDSVYGLLPFEVSVKPNPNSDDKAFLGHLVVGGKEIPVYSQKDPTLLPWKDLKVDVVIECTGAFTSNEKASQHVTAGAKAVVLSAPGKEGDMPTYVISVNDGDYKGESVISNASCTTNCITPVAKVIEETFGIEKAMMTTVHGYTSDQELQDGGHKDYRRARAAALNIIPTSTGATIAAGQALPALKGKFEGVSIRVPVPVGSLSDFTFLLKRDATVEEVNNALKQAAEKPQFKGILAVSEDPLVSSDIIGNSHSSIADLSLTQVAGGNMLKVIAWYDNEYGYANRLVEETIMVGEKVGGASAEAPTEPEKISEKPPEADYSALKEELASLQSIPQSEEQTPEPPAPSWHAPAEVSDQSDAQAPSFEVPHQVPPAEPYFKAPAAPGFSVPDEDKDDQDVKPAPLE
jgi:glyceraldehyde 3-phosphate dehydrogenase